MLRPGLGEAHQPYNHLIKVVNADFCLRMVAGACMGAQKGLLHLFKSILHPGFHL